MNPLMEIKQIQIHLDKAHKAIEEGLNRRAYEALVIARQHLLGLCTDMTKKADDERKRQLREERGQLQQVVRRTQRKFK